MKQSQFLLNSKIGEQQHKDCAIETYYKLKKPQQLAEIALDKSECDSFFRWRKYRKSILIYINRYKSDKQNIQKSKEFKDQAKHSATYEQFQNILTYHTQNTTSSNKKFRKILKNILSRKLLDERYRKRTWMIASNAIMNMSEDRQYYQQLKNTEGFPDYHVNSIHQDVSRTSFKQNKDDLCQKLNDILLCYQRRNPTIGYCQGMNYIVCFLLDLDFKEDEIFWMLVQILENILPIDYFPNFMLGLLCDLKIFNDLLKYYNNKLWKKFQEVQIDTSIILTHWLVCLFTNSAQKQVLLVIWDHLFAQGSIALFKASLIFFDICQEEIMSTNGIEILHKIEQKVSKYDDAVTFNQKMGKLYISKKAITVLRDLYRQIFHLEIDKDQQKIRNRIRQFYIKRSSISCNLEWPICHHYLEREKLIQEKDFDHFVLREKYFPPSIRGQYFLDQNHFSPNKGQQNTQSDDCKNMYINGEQQSLVEGEKRPQQVDETNNISDFDISHLDVIKQNLNITQLDRDLQINEISQIVNKHKSDPNHNENQQSPMLNEKKPSEKPQECQQEQIEAAKEQEEEVKINKEEKVEGQEAKEKENNDQMVLNYDFVSFLDEIDLKFNNDQKNDGAVIKSNCKLDDLFIMRTPHICHLQDCEVQDQIEEQAEANPLQQYIQSISEKNGLDKKEDAPQSVQFIKMFTPREVFSDLVFRDVSSYDSQFDEL